MGCGCSYISGALGKISVRVAKWVVGVVISLVLWEIDLTAFVLEVSAHFIQQLGKLKVR